MATLAMHPAMTRRPRSTETGWPTPAPQGSGAPAGLAEFDAESNLSRPGMPFPRQEEPHAAKPEAVHGQSGSPLKATEATLADPARVAVAAEQAHLAALAVQCLRGDASAWELLVRSQSRKVYGLCYRFTGSPVEAEDLTQDVFLKVYRNLRSFDPAKASFGVWLTALTRNLLVDNYRRTRLERASDSLDTPIAGDDDGPTRGERLPDHRISQEKHVAGVELRAKVQHALAHLSPDLREAVVLRDLEDMDYRDIAEVLGIPQGTVKSRISRGRAELARWLKGMEGQVM